MTQMMNTFEQRLHKLLGLKPEQRLTVDIGDGDMSLAIREPLKGSTFRLMRVVQLVLVTSDETVTVDLSEESSDVDP